MEARRVQQSGASTLTVSLPSEWVQAVGLRKGDRVLVTPTADGGLTLYPAAERERAPASVDVRARDVVRAEDARHVLRALYAAGWERVAFRDAAGVRPDVASGARDAALALPGLEVLSETRRELDFTASLDPSAFPLPALLRRIELTGATALADAFEALRERDPALAEAARQRALDGDRLLALARRQATVAVARPGLTRALAGSLRDAMVYRSAAEVLASVARDAGRVAEEALEVAGFDVRAPRGSLQRLEAARAAVERARAAAAGALFGGDPARALEALRIAPEARDLASGALRVVREGAHAAVTRRLGHVASLLAGVAESSGALAELALERVATSAAGPWAPSAATQ